MLRETYRRERRCALLPFVRGPGPASCTGAGAKSEQTWSLDQRVTTPLTSPSGLVVDHLSAARQPPPQDPIQSQSQSQSAAGLSQQQRFPTRPESPLAHARRGAVINVPPALFETSATKYRLSIALPRPGGALLASDMITISARRGGRLAVVADAWHLEHDCHYEWHVAFPRPDVDLGAVRARLGEDGILLIEVPVPRRRQANFHT
ncbi:hypothetical protein BJV74DRAFT_784966 [Russula compacta]|nr:hypothetical protein BJV74DRAFT_784966 [Russula compacta]